MGSGCALLSLGQSRRASQGDAVKSCAIVNRTYGDRRSVACEQDNSYDFEISGRHLSYDKRLYQEQLRIRIGEWLMNEGIHFSDLAAARLQLWFGTPMTAPDLPLLRVQVTNRGGNLLIKMPFSPDRWRDPFESIALLGRASYPEFTGIEAGKLAVELTPGKVGRDIIAALPPALTPFPGQAIEDLAQFYVSTPVFRETALRSQLMAKPFPYLSDLYFVPAGEIAGEFRAFADFPLVPPQIPSAH
jgi:hypothetical protein